MLLPVVPTPATHSSLQVINFPFSNKNTAKMVYTRWKCDRIPVLQLKLFTQEYNVMAGVGLLSMVFMWKHASFCSEETERKNGWWAGYPYWRDPIARRNEVKYKQLINNNNVDITDPKWTGCSKEQLERLRVIV